MKILVIAVLIAATAGPANAMKISFNQATGLKIGKTSVAHGTALGATVKGGNITAQGATATEIDLGKVKFKTDTGVGVKLPAVLLFK